jgi:hypothetical protein
MQPLTAKKLALAASGLVVWGYGVRANEAFPTYLGIAMLAAAVILRFLRPRDTPR